MLADNRLTENAGWDRAGLATELHQLTPLLVEAGLDIGLTGFATPEIDALMVISSIQSKIHPMSAPNILTRTGEPQRRSLGLHRHPCFVGTPRTEVDLLQAHGPRTRDHRVHRSALQRSASGRCRDAEKSSIGSLLEGSGELSPEAFTRFLVDELSLAAKLFCRGFNSLQSAWIGGILARC